MVLFIDSIPFGYTVRRSTNRIEWQPAENPSRATPPHLLAQRRNGKWSVEGTRNPDIIGQIMDEANQSIGNIIQHAFTVAP